MAGLEDPAPHKEVPEDHHQGHKDNEPTLVPVQKWESADKARAHRQATLRHGEDNEVAAFEHFISTYVYNITST